MKSQIIKKKPRKIVNAFTVELIKDISKESLDKSVAKAPEPKPTKAKFASKPRESRKTQLYQKYLEKRQTNGMPVLSQKIENKIYKLKQTLRKKNVAPEEIRQIIRKKRREEELALRRQMKTLCFNCREHGHLLADCPLNSNKDGELPADICYFCGSCEHMLHQCSQYHKDASKKKSLPYAKCFICGQMGHLTRLCAQNTKGVFPQGGKCRFCGAIDHLVKDCPRNPDKREEAPQIELKTYDNLDGGVDDEDYQFDSAGASKSKKKVAVTKF